MGIARDIARGQKHLERALDRPSFKWKGTDYPCTFASTSAEDAFGRGGLAPADSGTLYVRREVLPPDAIPDSKQEIIVEGKTFTIDRVATLPGKSVLKINYLDPNRGA
jgi:hypothetical protein